MPKQTPFEFFYQNAGFSYDPKTETKAQGRTRGAYALVDAERWSCESGCTYEWSVDPEIDSSDFSDETPAWQLWHCFMRDGEGKVCGSLGGIDFGCDKTPWGQPYMRVVEAELALEAMPVEERTV